eukprot:TRINITY_DN34992_c0_g1_i1.p1 TRINITY_DN34992_c0_g1~~TRINITY_DN34992_c0_g1_i1.p1  ORF type:complete len:251 (+),score=41.43 TRINITY_DN34992_c0_g1_i1:46-798(+)
MFMTVMVRLPNGDVCNIDITQTTTIRDLKQQVAHENGLQTEFFDISFEGAIIESDSRQLIGLGITGGCELELNLTRQAAALTRLGNRTICPQEVIFDIEHNGGYICDFIDAGFNPESQLDLGMNVLAYCAARGSMDGLRSLCSHPAVNINSVDGIGNTALHYACSKGTVHNAQIIINHPLVNVNAVNSDGWTPLYSAIANNRDDVVRLLASVPSVDVNKPTHNHWTPLRLASTKMRDPMVHALRDRGAIL